MQLSTLRMLLANSSYDHINLTVAIDPEEVAEGCNGCILTNQDTVADDGDYFRDCQYLLNP